jgi:hypothetical protein
MYTIIMQPPMLPPGEYAYTCTDDAHLRRVHGALTTLGVEIIDVEHAGESLTAEEFSKIVGE